MALTAAEEAQTRELIAQQAAILSLADSEAAIISNLGATDVSLSDLTAATAIDDADLLLIRQGVTDKSVAGSIVKAVGSQPDASETVKGIVEFATSAETIAGLSNVLAIHPAGLRSATRIRLEASLTLYVATTGSDSNDGLAVGTPFLTVQKAWDTLKSDYDLNGYGVGISIADGTYTTGLNAVGPLVGEASETSVSFNGNSSTPSNVFFSTTAANAFSATGGARFFVKDMKLKTTTSGSCINAVGQGSRIQFSNLIFDALGTSSTHINAQYGGRVVTSGAYSIIGGGYAHYSASSGGSIDVISAVTITGTPAFTSSFSISTVLAIINVSGSSYTGSATGVRYSSTLNSVINTNGGGATFFPGSIAGTTATGGQYV